MSSTHALVIQQAGLAQAGPSATLRLRVLTFNLGDNKKSMGEWLAELQSWSVLNVQEFDVLSVSLQEDYTALLPQGKLQQALAATMQSRGFVEANKGATTPALPTQPFAVKGSIFVRKSIYDTAFVSRAVKTLCLGSGLKKVACTKASVGLKIVLKAPYNLDYVFVASHMPVDTKLQDLGVVARVAAMKETVAKVVTPLLTTTVNSQLLVWAGDLNFRIQDGKDQLSEALAPEHGFGIGGLMEGPLGTLISTCKMKTNTGCRDSVDVATVNKDCYENTSDKPREPSHCDRVLYSFTPRATTHTLTESSYKAFVAPAVKISDHDAVVADFVL